LLCGQSLVTDVPEVGAANQVGVSPQDDEGVVDEQAPDLSRTDILPDLEGQIHRHFTMIETGHRHLLDLAVDEFEPLIAVLLKELFSSQQRRRRR
jgi:hypothetical protein